MRVLVTGGAGFLGSHVVRLLGDRGDQVVVVDDFSDGIASRVGEVETHRIDLANVDQLPQLERALAGVDAVVHFAAKKSVDESMRRPAWYVQQNLGGLANLLLAMERVGTPRLVFSSTASLYASSDALVREDDTANPASPYGLTKLVGEQVIAAQAAASPDDRPLRAISLRYFNVVGAGWPDLADTSRANLVPMVFERLARGEAPEIFGDDYATPDGTCVRDYIHVLDVADAHLAAIDALGAAAPPHRVYNVGTGHGTSVRTMIETIGETVGIPARPLVRPRRAGDAASVVAAVDRIDAELGWRASRSVGDAIESAWRAHRDRA